MSRGIGDARWLMPGIVALALAVRLWGIGFGLPYVFARPDEAQVAGPAVGYLSGDLRPPHLYYPTLFAYAVALLYVAYFAIARPFGGHPTLAAFAESRRVDISPFLYVTRGLSAVMGTLTVWWLYSLGRRAFGGTTGVVAAAYLAVAFLHVRDSHFGVTDVAMTALAVLAVWRSLLWRQEGGHLRALYAGLAAGLTASAKYNGAMVVAAFAAAFALRVTDGTGPVRRAAGREAPALALFAGGFAAAFFGTSPFVLIDWSRFVASMAHNQDTFLQGHGLVVGQGWWYYASTVLPAGVGWPILIAGAAGLMVLLTTRFRESAVVLAFPVVYYLVAGRGLGVFARYILPVIPFLCLTAAWLTVTAAGAAGRLLPPLGRRVVLPALAIAIMAPTAYKTVLLDRLLTRTDNREVTGRALVDLIAPGSLLYQTGESYGHASLAMDARKPPIRIVRYAPATGRYSPAEPEWILVQRSPLALYSAVPPGLDAVLRERYLLVRRFPTGSDASVRRLYDQQDAFYVPLAGLEGLRRPGPAFELYLRQRTE